MGRVRGGGGGGGGGGWRKKGEDTLIIDIYALDCMYIVPYMVCCNLHEPYYNPISIVNMIAATQQNIK